ncbi:MAG TPA: hypothetical protein VJ386_03255 [Candidatus Deferrimicrobiaceae bacterium]|nr:hypothetical protein [Candidatus Deferrimicrobiaceae bacterium]
MSRLLEVGRTDTVYRDLHLQRALSYFAPLFSDQEYLLLKSEKAEIDHLLRQSRSALESGDWLRVAQLSESIRGRKGALDKKSTLLSLGSEIYEPPDILLDPFSPGLQGFSLAPGQTPEDLRERLIESLALLEKEDAGWKDFYVGRRDHFQSLPSPSIESRQSPEEVDPSRIQREALQALEKGNIDQVEELAKKMLDRDVSHAVGESSSGSANTARRDLFVPFPQESLPRAGSLGFAPMQLAPAVEVGEYFSHVAWHPTFQDHPSGEEEWTHLHGFPGQDNVSPDVSRRLKDVVYLLMHFPFVNSSGVRYLPLLEAEDVLVEEFPEGKGDLPKSKLLSTLGLPRRNGLSRLEIELALFRRGPQTVKDGIGLDPRKFRLVCIPPDAYSRLGAERGWGRQEQWTHFDGYQVLKGGKIRALVGGDVRFGGIFDLCSINRVDEREGVIARFAVVRRERLGYMAK